MPPLPADVDAVLSMASPEVRAIALRAREVVRGVLPDALEMPDPADRLVGYGRDRTLKGLICAVALQRDWVNLMLASGAGLPDPDGLLEGTGKRARHVKLRSIADVDRAGVRALIEAARDHPVE